MSAEARTLRPVRSPIWRLLLTFSWQEWDRHGARHMADRRAVLLGVGLDALAARVLTPALMPQGSRDVIGNERLTLFDPKVIFLNARAQAVLGVVPGSEIKVQAGLQTVELRVAGTVSAGGEAL